MISVRNSSSPKYSSVNVSYSKNFLIALKSSRLLRLQNPSSRIVAIVLSFMHRNRLTRFLSKSLYTSNGGGLGFPSSTLPLPPNTSINRPYFNGNTAYKIWRMDDLFPTRVTGVLIVTTSLSHARQHPSQKRKAAQPSLLERLTPLGVYLVLFTLPVRDEMFYNSKTDCRSRATPAEKKSNHKTESYRHTLYLLFLLIYNKTRTFIFFRFGFCVRCFYAHILVIGFFIFRIILRAVFL